MSLPPWHAEIVELHRHFCGWLDGTTPSSEEQALVARVLAAQAPEFVFVTPGGERVTREALIADLRASHGSRPGWRMWSENVRPLAAQGGLTVVAYEEWHRLADGTLTGRVSTAVFREEPGAPNGVAWLLVHETWLPAEAQRRGPA